MTDYKNSPTFKRKFTDDEYNCEKRVKISHGDTQPQNNFYRRCLVVTCMITDTIIGMITNIITSILITSMSLATILVASMVIASIASLMITVLIIYVNNIFILLNITIFSSDQFVMGIDMMSMYILKQMSWLYNIVNYTFVHNPNTMENMCMITSNFSSMNF